MRAHKGRCESILCPYQINNNDYVVYMCMCVCVGGGVGGGGRQQSER